MTLELIAALIVLLVLIVRPGQVAHLRHFGWYRRWLRMLGFAEGGGRVALALVVPVGVCAVISHFLAGWPLAALAFGVLVLFYGLGPRELEHDFDTILGGTDSTARAAAAQHLRSVPDGPPQAFSASELVDAAVLAALHRRFGVLFWFFLFGPPGALGYRLAWIVAADDRGSVDPRTRRAARRFALALDWVPAHLMVLAMALVSDFNAVIRAWRTWYAQPGRSEWEPDPGFLSAVARAGVDADIELDDGVAAATCDPVLACADARGLMLRVLVVWLAVLALIVLAGWVA